MPGTDFFDDDLVRKRDAGERLKMGPGDEPVETLGEGPSSDDVPVRAISDLNLTRMARYKQQVTEQSAAALQELDRLKKRQEQLESEKRDLEELRRKHDDFERGKREMTEHLKRSLVSLERQEVETGRLVELLAATRKRFKGMLAGIEEIKEEAWAEDQIRDQLNRALGVIEDTRMEYNKAMSKIDAVKGEEKATPSSGATTMMFEDRSSYSTEDKAFGYWFKVGVAVTLPIVITLILLALIFYIIQVNGLI
jgi:hypothetical protein